MLRELSVARIPTFTHVEGQPDVQLQIASNLPHRIEYPKTGEIIQPRLILPFINDEPGIARYVRQQRDNAIADGEATPEEAMRMYRSILGEGIVNLAFTVGPWQVDRDEAEGDLTYRGAFLVVAGIKPQYLIGDINDPQSTFGVGQDARITIAMSDKVEEATHDQFQDKDDPTIVSNFRPSALDTNDEIDPETAERYELLSFVSGLVVDSANLVEVSRRIADTFANASEQGNQ